MNGHDFPEFDEPQQDYREEYNAYLDSLEADQDIEADLDAQWRDARVFTDRSSGA